MWGRGDMWLEVNDEKNLGESILGKRGIKYKGFEVEINCYVMLVWLDWSVMLERWGSVVV